MKIEKLDKNKSKIKIAFLCGFIIAVILIILINIFITKASYRKTESIPLAKGTINYSLADLNIIAMYKEKDEYTSDDDKYEQITEIPTNDFILSDKSYCEIDKEKEENIKIEYKNKLINVLGLTKKGTKCYIYFESISSNTLAKLGEFTKEKAPSSYTSTDTTDHGNLLYYTEDNDGRSYFYRGAAKNNWVKFGTNDTGDKDIWWRIIRINGDGTIRLIYTGMYNKDTNPEPGDKAYVTGADTLVAAKQTYSVDGAYNDNTYVGFYTGTVGVTNFDDTHSNTTPSNAANKLKEWYEGPNWNDTYNQYIDENAGFCNDRTIHPNAGTWWTEEGTLNRGTGTVPTAYGPFSRFVTAEEQWNTEQNPTLICGKNPIGTGNEVDKTSYQRDLYTPSGANKGNGKIEAPVGLITMDEAVFAGGFGGQNNKDYYLYDNQYFWTMSPYRMYTNGNADVFYMSDSGNLDIYSVGSTYGIRPLINLRADVKISGKGLSNDPYIIKTE